MNPGRSAKPILINRVLIVLGFIGILDAGILSLADTLGANAPCGSSHGCATVAQSAYSHFFGIPVAVIGLIGYIMLTVLASVREYTGTDDKSSLKANVVLSAVGFVVSLYFMGVMFGQIHALCAWCLGSAVNLTLTFILSLILMREAGRAGGGSDNPVKVSPVSPYLVPVIGVLALAGIGAFAVSLASDLGVKNVKLDASMLAQLTGPTAHIENPDGQMTIIEFGDLVCPVCHRVYPQVRQIVNQSGGKIKFIYHQFPLYQIPAHKDALPGAMMAEMAAEKGKFWQFVNAVYSASPVPAQPGQTGEGGMVSLAQMYQIMDQLGFKDSDVENRLSKMTDASNHDPAYQAVLNDLAITAKLGLTGTPTYFVIAPGQPVKMAEANVVDLLKQEPYVKYWGGIPDQGGQGGPGGMPNPANPTVGPRNGPTAAPSAPSL